MPVGVLSCNFNMRLLLAVACGVCSAQLVGLFDISLPNVASIDGLTAHPVSPLLRPLLSAVSVLLPQNFSAPAVTLLPVGSRLKAVANLPQITALLLLLKSLLESAFLTATELYHALGGSRRVLVAGLNNGGADPLAILTLQVKLGKSVLAVGLTVDKLLEETGLVGFVPGGLCIGGASAQPPARSALLAGAGGAFTSTAGAAFAASWLSGELAAQEVGCGAGGGALALGRVMRIKVLLEEMLTVTLLALCSAKEVALTCGERRMRAQRARAPHS